MTVMTEIPVQGVATVVLGDGSRRNALSREQWQALADDVTSAAADPDTRVVVLRGSGETFCAGFRIDQWEGADASRIDADFAVMEAACAAIEAVPVPTVALIQGTAAGAGCQLATACDLRLATDGAHVGMPILRLGIRCSPGFALRLTSLVGPARATELLFTGRLLDARTALDWGLLTEVTPPDELGAALDRLVGRLTTQPRGALVAAKAAIGVGRDARRREVVAPDWHFADAEMPDRVAWFLSGQR